MRLAADVEAEPLDDQPGLDGRPRSGATASPEAAPNFDDSSTIAPVLGTLKPQGQAGVRRVLADLADLREVVVRHQRLVRVQLAERLVRLDRIGVDDLVPDEVLPLASAASP